jgi:hypothetical protein
MSSAILDETLQEKIVAFSKSNKYLATHFAQSVCTCGATEFTVLLDDDQGCAARTCTACNDQQAIADGEEFLDEADLGEAACPCGAEVFTVAAGVALYADSTDVKWFYLGLKSAPATLPPSTEIGSARPEKFKPSSHWCDLSGEVGLGILGRFLQAHPPFATRSSDGPNR